MYTILTLSPGSTSTKLAVMRSEDEASSLKTLFSENITHKREELASFNQAIEQFNFRLQTILDALTEHGTALSDIDALSGYCGAMGPTQGGIFAIDQNVCKGVSESGVNHPAMLGALLLHELAQRIHKPAFAVDQPDTDELTHVARITGYPGVYRKSHVHCLNQKACARKAAQALGLSYEAGNFIVAHVGGGLSVAAHEQGRMIDTNDVLEGSGPFAPNRSGDVPAKPIVAEVITACNGAPASKMAAQQVLDIIGKTGGLLGLLGTDDAREVEKRIAAGDAWAKLCYEAMAYQVAKAFGAFASVLKGKVDALVLTGGVSHSEFFVSYIRERVDWIAPVMVFAGDFEMEALAEGALRALRGIQAVQTYTPLTSFDPVALGGIAAID